MTGKLIIYLICVNMMPQAERGQFDTLDLNILKLTIQATHSRLAPQRKCRWHAKISTQWIHQLCLDGNASDVHATIKWSKPSSMLMHAVSHAAAATVTAVPPPLSVLRCRVLCLPALLCFPYPRLTLSVPSRSQQPILLSLHIHSHLLVRTLLPHTLPQDDWKSGFF